ncbi:hypothetical protein PSH47_15815 [Pseudoalteromonas sp. CST5]|uniref:hypothetical protein n=1 Tax=unclassified Pseudoalteromonas TaxID=194690 RepID=UPI002359B63D|nr:MULTISPECIES: hypothetical protein [unclassified Pseudoalteromonas]MDC9514461.1 hypothetical protein [Pseudoalteromonas sp. CST1]MDC9538907.1 hypothetical protein [Pseudoalteromonas sp. CST3]MDC9543066.1 hypothetical protein [Pseudoalteromonas sp. CST2]MDC9545884.1 hypothetical protein [Pseudoalteromonas sp. CST4]MDC9550600.1 hypothetical protein [Pseudoalteromonas sp. CST5]
MGSLRLMGAFMALSKEQIQDAVKRGALIVLEYAGINYQTWDRVKRFFRTWGFSKQRQFEFVQDFSSWLNDGCSPSQACRSIMDAGKGDKRLQQEVNAATSIYDALKRGQSISEGMVDWFDPEVVTLFDAGQQAGSKALTRVVNEYLKQEAEIKRAKSEFWKPVKQPLTYFFMVIAFMMVMGLFVLPQFSDLMPPDKMTFSVRFVLGFSEWVKAMWPYMLLALLVVFIAGLHFVSNNTSKMRLSLDGYFPLNIYKNFAAMKTMKTLGILVETRYNLHKAATELKRNSNGYMVHHLNHIIRETQFGESDLGEALNSGLLSKRLMFRLRNAANSPDQDRKKSAISIAADRSGDEAVRALIGTRQFVAFFLWITMSLTLLMVVSSFMGVISSLFNMSYR